MFSCTSCAAGWVNINGACVGRCKFPCKNCGVILDYCTECVSGYRLDGGFCIAIPPPPPPSPIPTPPVPKVSTPPSVNGRSGGSPGNSFTNPLTTSRNSTSFSLISLSISMTTILLFKVIYLF
jgi:hypothetical protein